MPATDDDDARTGSMTTVFGRPGYDRLMGQVQVRSAVQTLARSASITAFAAINDTVGRTLAESAGITKLMETHKATAMALAGINTTAMADSLMKVAKASQMAWINDDVRKQIAGIATVRDTMAKTLSQSPSITAFAGINDTVGRTLAESAGITKLMETHKATAMALAGINTTAMADSLMKVAKASQIAWINDTAGHNIAESAAMRAFVDGARIVHESVDAMGADVLVSADADLAQSDAGLQEWWADLPNDVRLIILVSAWVFVRVLVAMTKTLAEPSRPFDPLGDLVGDGYNVLINVFATVLIINSQRRRT